MSRIHDNIPLLRLLHKKGVDFKADKLTLDEELFILKTISKKEGIDYNQLEKLL